uniref:Uncharacterized protein n=1 Tax=Arion vulgaris TaxID=1028688 RepID=A0A0B6Z9Q1_9EUPU
MSYPKPRKPRPLGYIRNISKSLQLESLNHQNLLPGISAANKQLQDGVHGSAMTVPPQSEPVRNPSRLSNCDRTKSDDITTLPSDNVTSHENCKKKIQEVLSREKNMKDQIELLDRQLEQLKMVICRKDEDNKLLEAQIETQEIQHTAQLNEERSDHERTKTVLCEMKEQMVQAHMQKERLIEEHKEEITRHKEQFEQSLKQKLADKDSVIADKELKISRLKSQMADALKGNSRERQQQLDELTKELSHLHEECDLLQMRLKSMSKNKKDQCSNCHDSSIKLTKLQTVIKERDVTIRELELLCSKFELQLTTQDKLLEQWAHSVGHKISAPK